jgi:hypothetical protein
VCHHFTVIKFLYFQTVVVSRLSHKHPSLTAEDFLQVHKSWTRDSKVAMIEGLSVLELCLVSDAMPCFVHACTCVKNVMLCANLLYGDLFWRIPLKFN